MNNRRRKRLNCLEHLIDIYICPYIKEGETRKPVIDQKKMFKVPQQNTKASRERWQHERSVTTIIYCNDI